MLLVGLAVTAQAACGESASSISDAEVLDLPDAAEDAEAPAEPEVRDALPARDAGADPAAPEPEDLPCVPYVAPTDCSVPDGGVLPADLRCTGLYGDAKARRLACGIEKFRPNYELWSDGAEKRRYIALPDAGVVDATNLDGLVFPVGTQLWKEFRITVGGERKLAETRLLRKSEQGWLYTSYVWSTDQSEAIQQNDGVQDLFGAGHTVPARDQCRKCHEGRSDFALGWDGVLLGESDAGLSLTELATRGQISVGDAGVADLAVLRSVVPGSEEERAALGYLHVNCGVSCHNGNSAAGARDTGLMLRLDHDKLGDVQAVPAVKTGINRVPGPQAKMPPGGPYYDIRPGDVERSLVVARMKERGNETQMPRLGTNQVDTRGVATLTRWISGMGISAGYPAAAPVAGGLVPKPVAPDAGTAPSVPVTEPPPNPGVPVPPAAVDAGVPPSPTADAGAPVGCSAGGAPDATGLAYEVVVRDSRLAVATFAAQAPGSDDWYIVDMVGAIWRVSNGALVPTPFLDLRDAVQLGAGFDQTTLTYDERGLVGLAFAADYQTSGLFYVALTPSALNARGLPVDHDMVLELRASQSGGQPEILRRLVDLPSAVAVLGNIHNINTLRFGPDGYLYVGSGDGGGINCNDAEGGAAQDVRRPFGKILRLDPKAPAPHAAQGNPFAASGDARVWHYGLRNPFRFSFDRQTGDLYLGDVGQDTYEELDFAPAGVGGLNFGWPTFEARASCPGTSVALAGTAGHTPPIVAINRSALAVGVFSDYRAVTGGVVYRGAALPKLRGQYLFGDYYGARLGLLTQCGAQTSPVAVLSKACDPNNPAEACLAAPAGAPRFESLTAIVEDRAGEVYFVANGNSLLRLVARRRLLAQVGLERGGVWAGLEQELAVTRVALEEGLLPRQHVPA
jgi:hypothetical protein